MKPSVCACFTESSTARTRGDWVAGTSPAMVGMGVRLPPLEFCRAFFEEGAHAFGGVLRFEERQELKEDVMHMIVEGLAQAHAHHALRRLNRERRVRRDL